MATIYTVYPAPQNQHSMPADMDGMHDLLNLKLNKHRDNCDHCLVRVFADHDGPTGEKFSHAYYCRNGTVTLYPEVTIPSALMGR